MLKELVLPEPFDQLSKSREQYTQSTASLCIVETSQSLPYKSADAIAVGLVDGAIAAGRSLTITDLIQQRQIARQQRDFATADQIRDQLAAVGISLVD